MRLQKAIDMIKDFEKCRLIAYKDGGGVWTCGWGSTGSDVVEGTVWTQEQADKRLMDHFDKMADEIQKLVSYTLPDDEMCAICSLVYNIGVGAFKNSTLLKKLNSPASAESIAAEFLRWDHDNGKQVAGLTRRREAEKALFLS